MKKYALALCLALPLLAGGCNNSAVTSVNNTLATLAKNDIPTACAIINVAEGYFANVKALVPTAALTAESTAAAVVATICASPPTDLASAFAALLNAWTEIQAATTVPK
jgi:hypothetical protein